MRLNYQHQAHATNPITMVFIHGLFGSLSNLGMLARYYEKQYGILQIDVRNHGLSEHAEEHNYQCMAQDIVRLLQELKLEKTILVGHSMGGKIAMKIASIQPECVEKLVVLDMTPIVYLENHHAEIFQALFAVEQAKVISRIEAAKIMREFLTDEMVIQFLLKSFNKGQWLFNARSLFNNYQNILDWETFVQPVTVPSLFLRGGNSFYISKPEQFEAIHQQFSNAKIELIEDAGHWLHGEKTADVLEKMDQFLV
jgi:esterase